MSKILDYLAIIHTLTVDHGKQQLVSQALQTVHRKRYRENQTSCWRGVEGGEAREHKEN